MKILIQRFQSTKLVGEDGFVKTNWGKVGDVTTRNTPGIKYYLDMLFHRDSMRLMQAIRFITVLNSKGFAIMTPQSEEDNPLPYMALIAMNPETENITKEYVEKYLDQGGTSKDIAMML